MWFVLLPFGGFWFCIAFLALFLFFSYEVFTEDGYKATGFLAASLVILTLFTNVPVIQWFRDLTWMESFKIFFGYFGLGILYMCLKWIYESYETMLKYSDFRDKWLAKYGVDHIPNDGEKLIITPQPEAQPRSMSSRVVGSLRDNAPEEPITVSREDFFTALYQRAAFNEGDIPPKISNHINDLIFWMSYWHLSFVATLFGSLFRRMIIHVIHWTSGPLNYVSKSMFKKFKELS